MSTPATCAASDGHQCVCSDDTSSMAGRGYDDGIFHSLPPAGDDPRPRSTNI